MFCPRCKAEYREGFDTCADCNVGLVSKLPTESNQDKNNGYVDLKEPLTSSTPASNNVRVHTMFKKIYKYFSFALFLLLVGLTVTGRSDILTVIFSGYLSWIKEASILVVIIVFLIASLLCSKFVTLAFFGKLIAKEKKLGSRIFWLLSTVFFVTNLTVILIWRARV